MATVAQQPQAPSAAQYSTATPVMGDSRSSSISQQAASVSAPVAPTQPPLPASQMTKKGKGKKNTDPIDASKQIAAKIAQLELDAAGERDQEAEIRGYTLSIGCFMSRVRDGQQQMDISPWSGIGVVR